MSQNPHVGCRIPPDWHQQIIAVCDVTGQTPSQVLQVEGDRPLPEALQSSHRAIAPGRTGREGQEAGPDANPLNI
jgi:hypothetical protein